MTSFKLACFYLALIALQAIYTARAAGQDEAALLAEYRGALGVLEKAYDPMVASGVLTREIRTAKPESKTTMITEELSLHLTGDSVMLSRWIDRNQPDKIQESVTVLSPRSSFTVNRKAKEDSYAIHEVGRTKRRGQRVRQDELIQGVFHAPYNMGMFSIPTMLGSGHFHVRKAVKEKTEDGEAVKFEFDYMHVVEGSEGGARYTGWFSVLPDRSWVLHEYRFQSLASPTTIFGSVDYESGPALPPLPSRVHSQSEHENGFSRGWTFEFKKIERRPTAPDRFTLTAFGLGDFEKSLHPIPLRYAYIVALVVGLFFILAGIMIQKYYPRKNPDSGHK